MEITIKKLRHCASLSQETHAFTAIICVDGVAAFEASNGGCGGPDQYHELRGYSGPSTAAIDAWLAANTPPSKGESYELPNCLEFVVCDLINAELARKRLDRLLKAKVIVIDTAEGAPVLFAYKLRPTPEALATIRGRIASGQMRGELVNGAEEPVIARALSLV
ncbi:hypothetical protein [Sphingomonas sp. R1]|uniref:hypothetical protein n=1 Tax=Sphingomonas sp. R1 TaxID=399176 RepID=UPI0022249122|nr:hypothetical protein [Sphingomonas sp. R1]UYY79684.1 hypothetical protein OIM94_19740 [Sphingomonas sp. R1]